jgi:peptide/nickel transport system substrate-binding protein
MVAALTVAVSEDEHRSTGMAKYRRLGVSLVAVIGLVLAACAPPAADDATDDSATDDAETTDDTDTDDGEATETADGGRLIVARTGDIDNLDPHLATAFQTYQTLELVYDTLFELTPELEFTEGLVESFEYDDSGTELTLQLRENVYFHDGKELDSEDVAASIQRILDQDTGAVARANLTSITEVETPEMFTVVLVLAEADGTLPAALADPNTAILSAGAIEDDTIGSEPMGTGAFVFQDWDQGQSVLLAAHEDHWGEGPYVDEVQFRVIPDESSLLAGMRAGEFHIGIMSDPSVVTQIDEGELTVERDPALAYRALMLNNEREPLGDQQVRQAIACAIDRQELVDNAVFGEGEPTGPFTAPAFAGDPYDGLPCDGRDVELAQQLLDGAGYGGGFSLQTIVITGEYETAINEAQVVQAQLSEIGIDLELEQLETNVYVERWLEADFDAAVALNGGRADPHQMYARYFASDGNLNDVATYSSDTLDQLFAEGKAETEEQARADIYERISQELLDASPWAWLFTGFEYRVLQPEVEGFVSMPTGSLKSLRDVQLG